MREERHADELVGNVGSVEVIRAATQNLRIPNIAGIAEMRCRYFENLAVVRPSDEGQRALCDQRFCGIVLILL